MTDRIKSLASEAGADLAPPLFGRELVSFKILHSGNVAVELADSTKFTIAARRHAGDDAVLPGNALTAETFLMTVGQCVRLPIDGNIVGRKFVRRASTDGTRLLFTEAGRDV